MIHIKRFIDRVSHIESKKSRDLIMPVDDARALRDELAKLLADLNESKTKSTSNLPEVIEVQVVGGKFK
jgi:hypothetical protein